MQDRIFYSICFGFVFGVFLRSFLFVNFYVAVWLGLISFALVLFFSLISKNKWGMILGVFVLTFSLGILRFHSADRHPPVFFESLVGKEASFVGVVVDEPDVREGNQKLTIATNEGKQQIKILATFNIDEYFQYGDEVNFSGTLNKPENFITDQGKDFDYVSYLRKDGIFYLMSYPRVEIISHNNGNKVKIALFSAKEKFLEKMNFAISEPESLLMGGFILGERSSFGT